MRTGSRFRRVLTITESIELIFEGTPLRAQAGDSIAAALLANGIDSCRSTPVSGSERGPFCLMGSCFDCMVVVNGLQNVQACMTMVEPGMTVSRQEGAGELG